MMIDYALERERKDNMLPEKAIIGRLPVAFAFGSGAELRRPLRIAIIGGRAVSISASYALYYASHLSLTWKIEPYKEA